MATFWGRVVNLWTYIYAHTAPSSHRWVRRTRIASLLLKPGNDSNDWVSSRKTEESTWDSRSLGQNLLSIS